MKPLHYQSVPTDPFAACGVQLVRLPGSGAPFGAGVGDVKRVTCRRCRRAVVEKQIASVERDLAAAGINEGGT